MKLTHKGAGQGAAVTKEKSAKSTLNAEVPDSDTTYTATGTAGRTETCRITKRPPAKHTTQPSNALHSLPP